MIQTQVLNRVLNSKDLSLITLNNLTRDYFSDYSYEYDFIINHYNTYNTVPDMETFVSKFPSFDVIKVQENDKYLVEELYKDKFFRDLVSTVSSLKSDVSQKDVDAAKQKIIDLTTSFSATTGVSATDIFEDTSRYDEYLDRVNNYNQYFISTGFPELDELIGGWDRHEEYATIFARTGNGKSWILDKMSIAAAEQGLNVGLYSGEMSTSKVGYRLDTLASGISNFGLSKGNIGVQNSYKKYLDDIPNRFRGHYWVATPNDFGGSVTVSALQAFVERYDIDILFIDQHSLLDDQHNAKISHERAANISRDIKKLQTLKRIPIITAVQQNRTKTDEGVNTTHIALSDRIAQDSTVILGLETKEEEMTISITKCRDAGTGKQLKYDVDFDKGIFAYIPDSDNEEDTEEMLYQHNSFTDEPSALPPWES